MNESPPGTVLVATTVAAVVLVVTWLTGVVLGSQLRAHGGDVAPGVDIAAFAITLPGVAASLFGLAQGRTAGVYRSLTAILVLIVSLLISLASIILFVGRSANVRFDDYLFDPPGRSFFFLQDRLSAITFVAAVLNLSVGAGLLWSRLDRAIRARRPRSD
jgi:hypothetical protein